MKSDFAAVLRSIRALQGLEYSDLAPARSKAGISLLERGMQTISLDNFIALSSAMKFDPVALMALYVGCIRDESAESALDKAGVQLTSFRAKGGAKLLEEQFENDELVKRPLGKPRNEKNFLAVKELKAAGFSRLQIIEKLGLPKRTVYHYWKLLP